MSWFPLLLAFLGRLFLRLRYKVKVTGDPFRPSKRGTLILANHPALIDPVLLVVFFWPKIRFHAVAADFLEQTGIVRFMLSMFGTIYVPMFDYSNNSYKQYRIAQSYRQIIELLKQGEAVLFYPSGGLKETGAERLGGASGVHHILQEAPETDILMIRTKGLWGSQFSRALTGKTPDLVPSFIRGMKILLKNGLFFTPKRRVTIECRYAPVDFPRYVAKKELNYYLEEWYNHKGPEPLTLISYSCLGVVLPSIYQKPKEPELNLDTIPEQVIEVVYAELAHLASVSTHSIAPHHDLSLDLGLDSLDRSQIVLFLKEHFGVLNVQVTQLKSVGSVLGLAAQMIPVEERENDVVELKTPDWGQIGGRPHIDYPNCETLIEGFLRTADRMGVWTAAVDEVMGEMSFKRFKLAVIGIAHYLSTLEEKHIGILLPSSIAANILIFGAWLAGKIPVMINWTLGGRNLQAIIDQTQLKVTISSWKFLDQLANVDLNGLDKQIITLEEIKHKLSKGKKIASLLLSWRGHEAILKAFNTHHLSGDDTAVILFTSGTESLPKGVPLTHRNIIENQKAALTQIEILPKDALLAFLPPFHSFGFSVGAILPLLVGWRAAFMPNPTQGRRIAHAVKRWKVTAICSVPTFMRILLRGGNAEQLTSLRLIISGAEQCPAQLVEEWKGKVPHLELLEGYGVTECSPILTLQPPGGPYVGVGKPLPGITIKIIHPETHESKNIGEEGEVVAAGPNVFSGYLTSTQKSPFLEIDGRRWYRTGDLGFLDHQGNLTLVGRLKRFVKIGGEMVSLSAIEQTLQSYSVQEGWQIVGETPYLVVCATEDPEVKTVLHLFITFPVEKGRMNELLREGGMSNLIRISSVHYLPILPLQGSGKIDYRALEDRLA